MNRFLLMLVELCAPVGGAVAALGWRGILGVAVGYFLAVGIVLLEDGREEALTE